MNASSRDKAVFKILEDPSASSSRLWTLLQNAPFIPTASGELKKVNELYVPEKNLQDLLEGEDCFPAQSYISNKKVDSSLKIPPVTSMHPVDSRFASMSLLLASAADEMQTLSSTHTTPRVEGIIKG